MAIAIACPSCGARMEYWDDDAGRAGQCPSCRAELRVPLDLKMCPGCRRNVAADAALCPGCGAALAPGATARPNNPPIAPMVPVGEQQTSGKSVWSLALGIFSLIGTCVFGLPAIILGAMALSDMRNNPGRLKGHGMAITGIVTGSLSLVSTCCVAFVVMPMMTALGLPAVQSAREAARRTQCRNNLKQIGLALHNYHDAFGSFPPAATYDAAGRPLLSWRVLILPFIEETALYQQFRLDEPWDSPNNLPLASRMPITFECPSHPHAASGKHTTCYVGVSGQGTVFPPSGAVSARQITDGTANTAMVGEVASSTIVWSQPGDVVFDANFAGPGNFTSPHVGGWQMLFCDGTVRFITNSIDRKVCRGLMTIAGNELINSDDY